MMVLGGMAVDVKITESPRCAIVGAHYLASSNPPQYALPLQYSLSVDGNAHEYVQLRRLCLSHCLFDSSWSHGHLPNDTRCFDGQRHSDRRVQPQLNNCGSLHCDHHGFWLPWHSISPGCGYCSRWRLHGLGAQLSDIRHRDPLVDSSYTDERSELHWGGNLELVGH